MSLMRCIHSLLTDLQRNNVFTKKREEKKQMKEPCIPTQETLIQKMFRITIRNEIKKSRKKQQAPA